MRMKRAGQILPLLALAACGHLASGPEQPIRGTWQWVRSTGGVAGREITPQGQGVSVRLVYDGRTAHAYTNGALRAEATYTVTELPTLGPTPVYRVTYAPKLDAFPFDALDEHTVRLLARDTVVFEDPCCDRWSHVMVERAD